MVLKEPKKYRQIVWLTPEQNQLLQEFVRKLDHEWPVNTAISEICSEALRDSDGQARIKSALNRARSVQKGTFLFKVCKWCGLKDRNRRYIEEHEYYQCSKRPLEVMLVD